MIGGFETKNERRRLAVASLRSSTRLSHPAAEQRAHGFARSTLLTFANLPLQRARMAGIVELICPTLQRKSATSWHDGQLEHDAHARGWRELIGFTAANIIDLLQTSSVIKTAVTVMRRLRHGAAGPTKQEPLLSPACRAALFQSY
jgi:hypothetical protein